MCPRPRPQRGRASFADERYWDHTGRRPKARSTLRHTPTRPGSTCKLLVPRKKVGCESGCAWRYSSTSSNFCAASTGPPKTQSDDNNPVTAIEIVDHGCRLSSRGNLYILTDARIDAELISYQISVDPIEKELCPPLVSREVRRRSVIPPNDCCVELAPKGDAIHDWVRRGLDF